ncbi:MAG: tyrosine-type recombinase/integrase [Pseudoxanthomonas mexicana]|nr:tyrosine-type recombinase/integrase [Pseudoxanthomonas mexicana]
MKLIWSTEDFKPAGFPIEGFPILLEASGAINPVVHAFLVGELLQSARRPSRATWANYAFALTRFFTFLEESSRSWNERLIPGAPSVVADFRSYLLSAPLKRSSVNANLDVIARLFQHSYERGEIVHLPFAMRESRSRDVGTHSKRSTRAPAPRPDVKLRASKHIPKILSASEVIAFLRGFKNETLRLMARLQVETGIRVEELTTFPCSYVVDPDSIAGRPSFIVVRLSPADMATKGAVERTIHVPRSLMSSLWLYVLTQRPSRALGSSAALFVTQRGQPYKTRSVWKLYRENDGLVGRDVNPHLLRHTYATHTLVALTKHINAGNALLYVRDRLGHASIRTTEIYLHYVDDMTISVAARYQSEISQLISDLK